jgi:hypothetical protein
MDTETELKQCTTCKEHKALDLFYNDKRYKDGKQTYCKSCHAARKRAWAKANPEKVAAKNRAYREANPEKEAARNRAWAKANPEKVKARARAYHEANREKAMLQGAKTRAKKNNLAFDLSLDDIQIPERCPILGIKLERGNDWADGSPSLDKIYPDKGYVKGNVQVISNLANRMKSNATFAQMVMLGKYAEPFTEKS